MIDTTFQEKFLPTQPLLSTYFQGDADALISAMYAATLHYGGAGSPIEEFTISAPPGFPPESNMSNVAVLQFLRFLVALRTPRRVLEVGTFLGISALVMASQMVEGGRLVTLEKFDLFADQARKNIDANGMSDRIQVIQGDADAIIQNGELPDSCYDLVFLDGNKEKYASYFRLLAPFIPKGGILVVDDVFFQGDALNDAPTTEKGRGAKAFLEEARVHPDFVKVVLPLGDGVMLLVKK